jgi:hypothetical protein
MLLSDERGRLARDETPYSLWKKIITLLKKNSLIFFFFFFLELYQGEAHLLLKSEGWRKKCKNAK